MSKHSATVDKHTMGFQDGLANKPKVKGLKGDAKKAYENGYAEGYKARISTGRKHP